MNVGISTNMVQSGVYELAKTPELKDRTVGCFHLNKGVGSKSSRYAQKTLILNPLWVIFTGEHHPWRRFSMVVTSPPLLRLTPLGNALNKR